MPTAAIAGLSAASSIFGARKQDKLQKRALEQSRMRPLDFNIGGIGVSNREVLLPSALQGAQTFASQGAAGILGNLDLSGGLPPDVQSALQALVGGAGNVPGARTGGLDLLSQGAGSLLPSAATPGTLAGTEGLRGLLSQGFNFDQVRGDTLANLRASAQPGNQRAANATLERLFGTGNLGARSTNTSEAFRGLAEAQNQQDLGFQLAAGQEARATQSAFTQDLTQRFGALTGASQLEDQLINSAFSRFGNLSSLISGQQGQAFRQEQGVSSEGFGRIQDVLAAITGAQGLPTALAQGQAGLAGNLLNIFGGVQDIGLGARESALNLERARTGAAGTGLAAVSQPGFGTNTTDALSSLLSGLLSNRQRGTT